MPHFTHSLLGNERSYFWFNIAEVVAIESTHIFGGTKVFIHLKSGLKIEYFSSDDFNLDLEKVMQDIIYNIGNTWCYDKESGKLVDDNGNFFVSTYVE